MRAFLLCTLLLLPRVAHATVVMDLSGPELAAISDAIVHARVVKLSGHVTAQARVFTDAELEVLDGLKGVSSGTRIRVSYPGGEWQGLGMLVSGQVALKENTECVMYLHKAESGYVPSGMRLGFYEVAPRADDGVRIATLSTEGLTLVRKQKVQGSMQTLVKEPRYVNRPLTLLLKDIRKEVAAAKTLDRAAILGAQR